MNDLPPPPPPRRRPPWTAIAFIAGLLLGWLAIGWWLWPVQWANSAPPQLSAAFQEAYLAAVAEGYALTSDLAQVQAAVSAKTRYVYIESPSNPLLRVSDIQGAAKIAHAAGALCVVDNTFASPYLQNPLALGADLVLHSLTKYLGGHSDVVGGALIGDAPELRDELAFFQNSVGGCLSPMDAFLVMRGIKTLDVRMQRHCDHALRIARHLESHAGVASVVYPGLESHPQHELACRQMDGFGGMVTFFIKGGLEQAARFLETVRIFTLAESLGGVESLVNHPAIMTHASVPPEMRRRLGISDTLIRLSVGIEDLDDQLEDLERALHAAAGAGAQAG